MSSKASLPVRVVLDAFKTTTTRQRPTCECIHTRLVNRKLSRQQARHVSTAGSQRSEMEVESEQQRTTPRWATTPSSMKAPVRTRPERQNALKVNTDQRRLDDVYVNILGRDGDKMLSEETKWLAVTSKSFDHGRRGFNDRLAFFGKRVVELQCSLGLLSVSDATAFLKGKDQDNHGREPFRHPAIEAVECLLGGAHQYFTHHKALSNLAAQYGLPEVVRWHPKNPDRLEASGADLVYSQALLAIVGALALEHGSAVANRIAKERILVPMGLKRDWTPKVKKPETSTPL